MSVSRDLFTSRVNSTMMSINERFTYLQKKSNQSQPSLLTIRAKNSAMLQSSAKNRRLAMQMERRLSAMAALKIKKKSIRQRLGMPNTNVVTGDVRDRLSLPRRSRERTRGRGRARIRATRGRSLQRSQSMQSLQGSLQRSVSMQSLNQGQQKRGRSRSRSRIRAQTPLRNSRGNSAVRQPQRAPSVNRSRRLSMGTFGQTALARQPGSFGQRRGRRNSVVGLRNQRLKNPRNKFGQNQRGGMNPRGRGRGRGRGNFKRTSGQIGGRQPNGRRGRGRGRAMQGRMPRGGGQQTKVIMPTKEELDKQLEQYMANTKSHLDKEIDTYMKESGANAF